MLDPTLTLALAISSASKTGTLAEVDREKAELRIYPAGRNGWYFIRADTTRRWYWKESAQHSYCNRADQDQVAAVVAGGVKVILLGAKRTFLHIWHSWPEFEESCR